MVAFSYGAATGKQCASMIPVTNPFAHKSPVGFFGMRKSRLYAVLFQPLGPGPGSLTYLHALSDTNS